jgi:transcriptional regulator with XRE-family HTH domain
MDFGKAVRRRRLALELTLEELAERADLTPNYLGSVENGRRDPSLSTVLSLARALGAAPGELLGSPGVTGEALELARLFDSVSADHQAPLLALVRSLARAPLTVEPASPVVTASPGRQKTGTGLGQTRE